MLKNKRIKLFLFSGSGIAVLVLLYFFVFKGIIFAQHEIGASKAPIEMNPTVKALNDAFQKAAEAVLPSVVNIKVKVTQKNPHQELFKDFEDFFERWGERFMIPLPEEDFETTAVGSGVFVTTNGYIVTNHHVIENAKEIIVTTIDRKEYKAKVVGSDKLTDIAVIKIDGEGFQPAHFANFDDVKVGELVIAVGNPLGLSYTVTSGIISAINRGGLSLQRSSAAIENFIQTDAPINPGNSGGGLFNLNGSLVGINSAIATRTGGYMGYGFAIPVDLVKTVASEIIRTGKFTRARLGVLIRTVDETLAKALGLKNVAGAVVNDVVKDSPAEKYGIEVEDVILEVDGKPVNTSNELQSEIAKRRPGETVELTIWRNGKTIKKKVKLDPFEQTDEIAEDRQDVEDTIDSNSPKTIEKLGLVVAPLTPEQKKEYNVKNGVYVTTVNRNSPVRDKGISSGCVITKVNNQEIKSVKEFEDIVKNAKSGDVVLLRVKYKDSQSVVAVEIP